MPSLSRVRLSESEKMDEDACSSSSKEREARSLALEKAYVHDVYQQIASHFSDSRYRQWPKVKQFLLELEPGSIVCDVGCGNGKYLGFNPFIYKIGLDRCSNLTNVARDKGHEVLISDNLALPFRDECFDAVLSMAVIHHFATTERRVAALKELARVLRIGGRLMVSVWAMEQRHRKFESQDVLVPWTKPMTSSSDDKTSSIERDLNSTTTTTSDDDATHYHAYTQTSDSDSFPSFNNIGAGRKRGRIRHRGRSIDPACASSSQSSSDLSSPNESCYSFVRRALQKLAGSKRNRGGRRPWFLQGLDIPAHHAQDDGHLGSLEDDMEDMDVDGAHGANENLMPIELRQLESSEFADFLQLHDENRRGHKAKAMLLPSAIYPRRRTLDITCQIQPPPSSSIAAQPKSKSLSDLFGLLPVGILRSQRKSIEDDLNRGKFAGPSLLHLNPDPEVARSQSSLSGLLSSDGEDPAFPDSVRHKSIQTDSPESSEAPTALHFDNESVLHGGEDTPKKIRPALVKQKHSIGGSNPAIISVSESSRESVESHENLIPMELQHQVTIETVDDDEDGSVCWGDMKKSVQDLPEVPKGSATSHFLRPSPLSAFWKQTSLNDELICSERMREKESMRQHIQKQCSLNEELISKGRRDNSRWDQMKEAFLNSPNVKCLQILKNGLLNSRFHSAPANPQSAAPVNRNGNGETLHSPNGANTNNASSSSSTTSTSTSLRNGLVRILQNWKQSEEQVGSSNSSYSHTPPALSPRRGSKEASGVRRGLFSPFFIRRSSAGSLNLKANAMNLNAPHSPGQIMSPPHLKRRPSDNELFDSSLSNTPNGNKLLPGVRHVRKLSREEGSDSSKDSSFQSDTSVDSEDSFASVIFIPRTASTDKLGSEAPTRANSTDSDRSPRSPASRLSPSNHNVPKSPSPLASEILRTPKKSPELSPTFCPLPSLNGTSPQRVEATKFLFDESATKRLTRNQTTSNTTSEMDVYNFPIGSMSPKTDLPQRHSAIVVEQHFESSNDSTSKRTTEKRDRGKASDRVEVLRKPAVLPENKSAIPRQLVRRSFPKALAVELFNPETDDADTSDTSSSSPNSISSVVSVVNEDSWAGTPPQEVHYSIQTSHSCCSHSVIAVPKESTIAEEKVTDPFSPTASLQFPHPMTSDHQDTSSHSNVNTSIDTAAAMACVVSVSMDEMSNLPSDHSLENLTSQLQSSPKARRKLTLARLGTTSDWLSTITSETSQSQQHTTQPQLTKRSSIERRHPGEKILLGEVKKQLQKGPDAKWPSSLMDDSPPQTAKLSEDTESDHFESETATAATDTATLISQTSTELTAKLVEDMEEREREAENDKERDRDSSLFDSLENLSTSRGGTSRNPSIDSSLRMSMSSTCSCSLRGGDSFDSWTSAKSSLTSSSSIPPPPHLPPPPPPAIIPLQPSLLSAPSSSGIGKGGTGSHGGGHGRSRVHLGTMAPSSSMNSGPSGSRNSGLSGGTATTDEEESTALTYHRYYHVFREGELDKLIEKYVQNLHIISSYYAETHWVILCEKVQVWTI